MKWQLLRGTSMALVPLALAAGSLSYYSKDIRLQLYGTNQERAIAEIENFAGTYKVDERLPAKPIVKVDLSFSDLNANTLSLVGGLPHLRYLNLLETETTDEDLEPLCGLMELRSLNLMSTRLRGAGLVRLSVLVQLQSLNLQATQVGDQGLSNIREFPSLRELDLAFTNITDRGLAHFRIDSAEDGNTDQHGPMALAFLNLKGTRINGEGLGDLAGLPHLKRINLDGSQVTDDGLASLEQLSSLRVLSLNNTQITDEALIHLKPLKQLRA